MHTLAKQPPEISENPKRPYLHPKPVRRRRWLGLALILAGVVVICFALFGAVWPFTQSKVIAHLEEKLGGRVTIGKFHRTWFPPGCVAEDVTFTGYGNIPNSVPITVSKMTLQGSFRGLFIKHVSVLQAEGARLVAPSAGYFAAWRPPPSKSDVVVDKFVITESLLGFSSGPDKPPLQFAISRLELSQSDAHGVKKFQIALHNPSPPGEVQASGYLGPWRKDNAAQTPIAGSYSFRHANLGAFHGIAGILSSDGSFQGTIEQLEVNGKASIPGFEVTDAGHRVPLVTQFQATVTTRHGDVSVKMVKARLGRSSIESAGTVSEQAGHKGKVTSLNLLVHDGRIQDFLFLFLEDPTAPMTGRFNFKGQAVLPPEKAPFTRKIQLQGDFGVEDSHLSNPDTQSNLEQLSERAEGEKDDPPESVVSDLKGHVVLRDGIATFSNLSFSVPGATAKLHGTYSLLTHRINLSGNVFMKANLPQVTSGVKSFFLKIINPFLKKNRHGGAIVPVTVTGVYPHPVYKTDPI